MVGHIFTRELAAFLDLPRLPVPSLSTLSHLQPRELPVSRARFQSNPSALGLSRKVPHCLRAYMHSGRHSRDVFNKYLLGPLLGRHCSRPLGNIRKQNRWKPLPSWHWASRVYIRLSPFHLLGDLNPRGPAQAPSPVQSRARHIHIAFSKLSFYLSSVPCV